MDVYGLPVIVVAIGLLVASFTDVRRFKVYNSLTFPIFFGGLLYGTLTNGWSGLGFAFAGSGLGFVVLLLPYLMGGLGAGDVKFVMAMGTWLGAQLILPAILIGAVSVIVYHGLVVVRQRGIAGWQHGLQLMLFRLSCFGQNLAMVESPESVPSVARDSSSPNRGRLIPFSAMMSIGILTTILISWWMQSLQR